LCPDKTVQIDDLDSNYDLSGLISTFDPLEGQGNMLNAQSTIPNLPETQTTTEIPKTLELSSLLSELAKLATTEPTGPPTFTAMSTKASTITTKNPVTTTKENVATGAMLTLNNRFYTLNTDEEDSSLHEVPESQASAEENSKWWIWPLFCVSVGTILRKFFSILAIQ
jgi:hypothetical protein